MSDVYSYDESCSTFDYNAQSVSPLHPRVTAPEVLLLRCHPLHRGNVLAHHSWRAWVGLALEVDQSEDAPSPVLVVGKMLGSMVRVERTISRFHGTSMVCG